MRYKRCAARSLCLWLLSIATLLLVSQAADSNAGASTPCSLPVALDLSNYQDVTSQDCALNYPAKQQQIQCLQHVVLTGTDCYPQYTSKLTTGTVFNQFPCQSLFLQDASSSGASSEGSLSFAVDMDTLCPWTDSVCSGQHCQDWELLCSQGTGDGTWHAVFGNCTVQMSYAPAANGQQPAVTGQPTAMVVDSSATGVATSGVGPDSTRVTNQTTAPLQMASQSQQQPAKQAGISTGAKIGIAVAAVIGLILVGLLVWLLVSRRSTDRANRYTNLSTETTGTNGPNGPGGGTPPGGGGGQLNGAHPPTFSGNASAARRFRPQMNVMSYPGAALEPIPSDGTLPPVNHEFINVAQGLPPPRPPQQPQPHGAQYSQPVVVSMPDDGLNSYDSIVYVQFPGNTAAVPVLSSSLAAATAAGATRI